jgi:hypothetical protein
MRNMAHDVINQRLKQLKNNEHTNQDILSSILENWSNFSFVFKN